MEWYLKVLSNYANFKGRARRKEYWMFLLVNFFIGFGFGVIEAIAKKSAVEISIIRAIYNLAIFIPSIAVGVRRMQDSGHSGWWLFVPIVNLIFLVSEGDEGPNEYGPDPKGRSPQGQHMQPAYDGQPSPDSRPVVDNMGRLEKLNELRGKGVITDEEFQEQKRKLLAS
jgi:uncharacterized membrane protein YhaH (DUF805 family)